MWASLQPDGELSQFERRILEAHLARCADCARHAEQLTAIVAVIRDTPSESMRSPVEVVRRPRVWGTLWRVAVGGSAMAAAVAAGMLTTVVGVGGNPQNDRQYPPVIIISPSQGGADELALWRQTQRAKRAVLIRPYGTRGRGPVLSDQPQ